MASRPRTGTFHPLKFTQAQDENTMLTSLLFLVLCLTYRLEAAATGCAGCDIQGTCVKVGQNHTHNCAVYHCAAAGSYSILKFGCMSGSSCLDDGFTWKPSPCITKKCTVTKSPWHAAISIDYMGCNVNGVCKDNGVIWNYSTCIKQKCVVTTNPHKAAVVMESVQCKDSNGACHPAGETFAWGGHTSCTCTVDSKTWKRAYSCTAR